MRAFFASVGRWWPGPASHVAEALFLRPPRHTTPSRERKWLASAERFEVESPAGPLTAWSWSPADREGYALRHGLETERLVFVAPGVEPSLFTEGMRRLAGIPQPVLDRMRERLEARFGIRWEDFRVADFAPQRTEELLVVHDRLDEEVPCWHSRELVEAWPGARLDVVSGLGHRRIPRDPRVVERTTRFLASRSGAREEAAA